MDAIQDWMTSTRISQVGARLRVEWPTLETLHFLALCLLMGSLLIMDLRLIGFQRTIPLTAVHALMPVAIGSFAVNLITGPRFPVRRSAHLHGELGVLGEDVARRCWPG